jgi:hypothetical protein
VKAAANLTVLVLPSNGIYRALLYFNNTYTDAK